MFCVKEVACNSNKQNDIAISRHHFDAALSLVTAAHVTDVTPEAPRLLLAG
jgi:hypothetical protein